jgi:hypothetical protein
MSANEMRGLIDLVDAVPPGGKSVRIEIVSLSSFKTHDEDPDDYLYHVTTVPNARTILASGFQTNRKSVMTNYRQYSKGKIFFTERDGVPFWLARVEDHLFSDYDNPPDVAVLRVPKSDLEGKLIPDEIGSNDAHAKAYYIT